MIRRHSRDFVLQFLVLGSTAFGADVSLEVAEVEAQKIVDAVQAVEGFRMEEDFSIDYWFDGWLTANVTSPELQFLEDGTAMLDGDLSGKVAIPLFPDFDIDGIVTATAIPYFDFDPVTDLTAIYIDLEDSYAQGDACALWGIWCEPVLETIDDLDEPVLGGVVELNEDHSLIGDDIVISEALLSVELAYDYTLEHPMPNLAVKSLSIVPAVNVAPGEPFRVQCEIANYNDGVAKYDFEIRVFDGDPDEDGDNKIDQPLPAGVREIARPLRELTFGANETRGFSITTIITNPDAEEVFVVVNGDQMIEERAYGNNFGRRPSPVIECPEPGPWYVSSEGDDSGGDGSFCRPWATIAHALARLRQGEIIVLPGVYSEYLYFGAGAVIGDLDLRGVQTDTSATFLQGEGGGSPALHFDCRDCAHDITVSGMAVSGYGGLAALRVEDYGPDALVRLVGNHVYENSSVSAVLLEERAEVSNNTIVANEADGIVIDGHSGETVAIFNNLVTGNQTGIVHAAHSLATPILGYNNVWSNDVADYLSLDPGEGDTSVDPLFRWPEPDGTPFPLWNRGGWGLISPCMDAGRHDVVVDDYHFVSDRSFDGMELDQGAYEVKSGAIIRPPLVRMNDQRH